MKFGDSGLGIEGLVGLGGWWVKGRWSLVEVFVKSRICTDLRWRVWGVGGYGVLEGCGFRMIFVGGHFERGLAWLFQD